MLMSTFGFAASAAIAESADIDSMMSARALYSCPNGSHQLSFTAENTSTHNVKCVVCDIYIAENVAHTWLMNTPDCMTAKYCTYCGYEIEDALGHIVSPSDDFEFVAIDGQVHGHICLRDDCVYNPESSYYGEAEGYIPEEPWGTHRYFEAVYYTTYQGTDGIWRHMKYQDCSDCGYTKHLGFVMCGYNSSQCTGGCQG